jgi:hypothetical protein
MLCRFCLFNSMEAQEDQLLFKVMRQKASATERFEALGGIEAPIQRQPQS